MNTTVCTKTKTHGMLGDCFRGIRGNACYFDAKIFCGLNVDGIKSGAAHEYELDAKACKNLKGHDAGVSVDKGANGIVALCE